MKGFKLISTVIVIFGIINISCNQSASKNKVNKLELSNDSIELTNLTRHLYKWIETKSSKEDFKPKIIENQDISYKGIDWDYHSKRLKELEETNFFSKDFLDNYNKIAKTIDNDLKKGFKQWLIGELPPFRNDSNPWCNCQDNPDEYWKTMTITDIKKENNNWIFKWKWGNEFSYKVIATKINGSFRIKYLEGFDYNNYK